MNKDFLKTILSILVALAFFIGYNYENESNEPYLKGKQEEVKNEYKFEPLTTSKLESTIAGHKMWSAWFANTYTDETNYHNIGEYYDKEFKKYGWVFKEEKLNMTQKEITYSKGEYELVLSYWTQADVIKTNKYRYLIHINWRRK